MLPETPGGDEENPAKQHVGLEDAVVNADQLSKLPLPPRVTADTTQDGGPWAIHYEADVDSMGDLTDICEIALKRYANELQAQHELVCSKSVVTYDN